MARKKKELPKPLTETPHGERIVRLRRQMIVHSFMYYRMGESVISDAEFDKRAYQLVDLQKEHGTNFNFYDKEFEDWDGSTGFHFSGFAQYEGLCRSLLEYEKNKNDNIS